MKQGKIIYVMGPSGAGKDSVLDGFWQQLGERQREWYRAPRVITRSAEAGGENHISVSINDFLDLEEEGSFLFSWQANDLHYGILKVVLEEVEKGKNVIINGSRAYLDTARAVCPDLEAILITAPPRILAERLAKRKRESAEDIIGRLRRAEELDNKEKAIVTIMNDGALETSIHALSCYLLKGEEGSACVGPNNR